jgi:alpha-beta hydrolase superfamily lysophospholipase
VTGFELNTLDGVSLAAHRHRPARTPRSSVVLAHGFTASKDHPEVRSVAAALSVAGHEVIVYDSRGHGTSGGLCTLGDAEWMDVAAAVAAARTDSDRVVTVGASMGAIAVLRHGAEDAELTGVVSVSAPARWTLPANVHTAFATTLTRTRLGRRFADRRLGVRIHPVWSDARPPVSLVESIKAPLALIHGDADRMIPAVAARELAGAATGRSSLDIVAGMQHAFHPMSIPAIVQAVDWVLGLDGAVAAHA